MAGSRHNAKALYYHSYCSICRVYLDVTSATVETPSHIRCPKCKRESLVYSSTNHQLKGGREGIAVYKTESKKRAD